MTSVESSPTWATQLEHGLLLVGVVSVLGALLTGLLVAAVPLGGLEGFGGAALLALHVLAPLLACWALGMAGVLRALSPLRRGVAELLAGGGVLSFLGGLAFVLAVVADPWMELGALPWKVARLAWALGCGLGSVATCLGALQARARGGPGFVVGIVAGGALLAWSVPTSLLAIVETLEALGGRHPIERGPALHHFLWIGAGLLLAVQARGEGPPSVVDRWGFVFFLPVALAFALPVGLPLSRLGPAATALASLLLAVSWMATSSGGWIGRGLLLSVGWVWLGVELGGLRVFERADIFLHDTFAEVALLHLQWPFVLVSAVAVGATRRLRGGTASVVVGLLAAVAAVAAAQVCHTMWLLGVEGLPRRYGGAAPTAFEGSTVDLLPGGLLLVATLCVGGVAWGWTRRPETRPTP